MARGKESPRMISLKDFANHFSFLIYFRVYLFDIRIKLLEDAASALKSPKSGSYNMYKASNNKVRNKYQQKIECQEFTLP